MNNRKLKIEADGDYWLGLLKPKIRLRGRWLERAGFKPGDHVHVTCVAPGVIELRADDLQTQTVLGTKVPTQRPDHVSMSPSGRWCTISNLASGGGTVAWNNTYTQSRQLHLQSEHSDLVLCIGSDYTGPRPADIPDVEA